MLFLDCGRHRVRRRNLARRAGFGCDLSQPEIQNLGVPAFGDKDIRRLDIAVNDSLRMRGIQPVGNLNRKGEHAFVL